MPDAGRPQDTSRPADGTFARPICKDYGRVRACERRVDRMFLRVHRMRALRPESNWYGQVLVSDSPTARFLHVANGTCTTEIIEAAGIPGALSIWADPLYEGPVPGGLSDEELLDVRARHLAQSAVLSYAGTVNDLRGWRQTIEADEAYDELVLWFEHDLFDQLNLIQLLTWIRPRLTGRKTVSLVCIGSFPGRSRFKGLGELTPQEL